MEVILDSSFIISCVRKNIDFLSQLEEQGFRKIVVPKEVREEMKDLRKSRRASHADRAAIDLAFDMIEKSKVKRMGLGGKNVDMGLIEKGKQGAFIATLDRAIKREVPNRVVIFSAGKKVGVEQG